MLGRTLPQMKKFQCYNSFYLWQKTHTTNSTWQINRTYPTLNGQMLIYTSLPSPALELSNYTHSDGPFNQPYACLFPIHHIISFSIPFLHKSVQRPSHIQCIIDRFDPEKTLGSSIHPLWKILEMHTTEGVWVIECAYLLCDFQIRFITEGVNISFKSAKWAYLLGIHTPPVGDVS